MKATHSSRECFIVELAKACPQVTPSQIQRLFRLSHAHSECLEAKRKAHIEGKIQTIARMLGIVALFPADFTHSVQLFISPNKTLEVPTSEIEP